MMRQVYDIEERKVQYIKDGTKIVLWGVGKIGLQIINGEFGNYDICFAVDSKIKLGDEEYISNISVHSPSILKQVSMEDKLLVIAMDCWIGVAEQLEKTGRHMFLDYIPYVYLSYSAIDIGFLWFCKDETERKQILKQLSFGKKLCGLYGYCHTVFYTQCLLESREFTEKYCLIDFPTANVEHKNLPLLNEPWIYSALDVLILGYVYPEERWGTPYWRTVQRWVGQQCRVVVVTSAAFNGYFLQQTNGIEKIKSQICWGDKNLNRMIQEGKTEEEVLQILSAQDFYRYEDVEKHYNDALKKLDNIEKKCDVKIGDYIRKNGKKKVLMYSSTHPKECVMLEITRRIFEKLELDVTVLDDISGKQLKSYKTHGEFIYPSVYYALGLECDGSSEMVCVGDDIGVEMSFTEFVHTYMRMARSCLVDANSFGVM